MSTHLWVVLLLMACFLGNIVSQEVSWLPRTSENCLRHGLDSITEKVKITRKENKYETSISIAKGASFEFMSSPLCELSNLHTAFMPYDRNISSICYCESSSEEEMIIVLNMTADVKYSKQNISVTVPCIHKEKSTRKQRELQTIITFKYVFKLNGQVVQDLSSVLYHHGPFHIELCCIQEIADFPCTSTISYHTKNESKTPCVSIIQNPSKVTNYTLSIEVCDKIQIIRNATIHPLSASDLSSGTPGKTEPATSTPDPRRTSEQTICLPGFVNGFLIGVLACVLIAALAFSIWLNWKQSKTIKKLKEQSQSVRETKDVKPEDGKKELEEQLGAIQVSQERKLNKLSRDLEAVQKLTQARDNDTKSDGICSPLLTLRGTQLSPDQHSNKK